MIRQNNSGTSKSKIALVGFFALPTSARAHVHEPARCSAFAQDQTMYVLRGTDEKAYPKEVVLCAFGENPLELEIGSEIQTQHAQVRKNLPNREVVGMVLPDGSTEGELPAKGIGLPHWEFIGTNEDGSASQSDINAVSDRLETNKASAEAAKQAVRQAKATKTKAA